MWKHHNSVKGFIHSDDDPTNLYLNLNLFPLLQKAHHYKRKKKKSCYRFNFAGCSLFMLLNCIALYLEVLLILHTLLQYKKYENN